MNWKNIKEEKPITYKKGDWEGLKSDKVLVSTGYGEYQVAEMYEGILDGNKFCDFYDERDFEIKGVKYWSEIDSPF